MTQFVNFIKDNLIIFGGILFLLFLWVWAIYNSLVRKRNQVKTDLSDINVQLGKKAALVDRFVSLVKEYSKHERDTFKDVTEARSQISSSKNASQSAKAERLLSDTLKSLMLVVEDYPKLQASQNYRDLQSDLKQIEETIASYRETYNISVQDYNNSIQVFPSMLISSLLGFKEAPLFEISQ